MIKNILDIAFLKEFHYRNSSSDLLKKAPDRFQQVLVHLLQSKETHPAHAKDIEKYFGPSHLPGTSAIGLRKERPEIFQDTLHSDMEDYETWLNRILEKIMNKLASNKMIPTDTSIDKEIVSKVNTILEFNSSEKISLRNLIPQQTYEDFFMHLVMVLLHDTFEYEPPDPYWEFNAVCHRIAIACLEIIENNHLLGVEDQAIQNLLHIAVLSGYVGVNLKSTASAASALLNRDLIPVPKNWIQTHESVEAVSDRDIRGVAQLLIHVSKSYNYRYGLDCFSDYTLEVIHSSFPTLLIFFSDDYLETLIDIKRFDLILEKNPNINLLLVPRNGRYGNDFAFSDMESIYTVPLFEKLLSYQKKKRLFISPHGPKGGCIDPRFLSQSLIEEIEELSQDRRIILETKGCRNFEMLQGQLPLPWYASFNCNRALSIRTVGIDIDPVFLRIPPGLCAYDGFLEPVIGETPSGLTTGVRFARMTTRDLLNAIQKDTYKDLSSYFPDEYRLNSWLMRFCRQNNLTLPELLDSQSFYEAFKPS